MLNAQKCTVTKFTRNTVNFVNFDYTINDVTLENKPLVKDLGAIFDNHVTFANHCKEQQVPEASWIYPSYMCRL